jgi:hypothetical protein
MESFFPYSIERATLPTAVPTDIQSEFREAENCAGHGDNRAASALFRSVLEKALTANGYTDGSLYDKINACAADGVITEARKNRAQADIRVLGNDVLHDAWRIIGEEEVASSHLYTQRVLEDLYDDRPSVQAILTTKQRITAP